MLIKIAKKLKKNNVAVDIVSFGHEADNEEKLTAFHGAVNSNDNSHLVTVPPGPVLSDVLIGSPIFQVGAATGSGFCMRKGCCQRYKSSSAFVSPRNLIDNHAATDIGACCVMHGQRVCAQCVLCA